MRCPSCSAENLPVRETSSMTGSQVRHPRHCGECGHALTAECPVCTYHHAIGTKFCQADGTDINAWLTEENAWKALVASMKATLTVRPSVRRLVLALSALPGLYFLGGYFVRELMQHAAENIFPFPWLLAEGIVSLLLLFLAVSASMFAAQMVIWGAEHDRFAKLYREQEYRTYKPSSLLTG